MHVSIRSEEEARTVLSAVRSRLAKAARVPIDDVEVLLQDRAFVGLILSDKSELSSLEIHALRALVQQARATNCELYIIRANRFEAVYIDATFRLGGISAVRELVGPRLLELPR